MFKELCVSQRLSQGLKMENVCHSELLGLANKALSSIFNYNNNNTQWMILIIILLFFIFKHLKTFLVQNKSSVWFVFYVSLLAWVLNPPHHLPVQVPGVCVCVAAQIFSSPAHSHTLLQHGGGFSEGGGEGATLQLQRDGEGKQVHHSDVRKHHK